MRCVRCGWPSKNYEMSNDGRPYTRLDKFPGLLIVSQVSGARSPSPAYADLRSRQDETGAR